MGHAREAVEEIVALDGFAEYRLLPARMELAGRLDVATVKLEEDLVVVVPLRAFLAGLEIFKVALPFLVEGLGVVAIVFEEFERVLGQALKLLLGLVEDVADAIGLPFELGHVGGGLVVAHGGVDERLQRDACGVGDVGRVVHQTLAHLVGVQRLAVGAQPQQQRRALGEKLLEGLLPRLVGRSVCFRAGEERGVPGQAHLGQRPPDGIANRQTARRRHGLGDVGAEIAELHERQVVGGNQAFEGRAEHLAVFGNRRHARDVACGIDPRLLVGAKLLGAQGGDVPERVGQIVLVAIGGEDRLLAGLSIVAHEPRVVLDQRLGRQALALDQGLGDHEIDAGGEVVIGQDRARDRGDLRSGQLVEAEQRRRILRRAVGLASVIDALGQDVGANAPNDPIGQQFSSPLNPNGFSTNEHESDNRRTSPSPTSRASRLARFSLSTSWSTFLSATRRAPSASPITSP